jgi:hypothetical protein
MTPPGQLGHNPNTTTQHVMFQSVRNRSIWGCLDLRLDRQNQGGRTFAREEKVTLRLPKGVKHFFRSHSREARGATTFRAVYMKDNRSKKTHYGLALAHRKSFGQLGRSLYPPISSPPDMETG